MRGTAGSLLGLLPPGLVPALAGLALMSSMIDALQKATNTDLSLGAFFALVIAGSGLTILGIGPGILGPRRRNGRVVTARATGPDGCVANREPSQDGFPCAARSHLDVKPRRRSGPSPDLSGLISPPTVRRDGIAQRNSTRQFRRAGHGRGLRRPTWLTE